VGANLLLTYLLATTPMFDLIKSLRTIGIPAVMIELMGLMMRYFFLLLEESRSMMKAQKSRGMRMEKWFWSIRTYHRFGQMLGVLFIRALSRSERIYLSISARGGLNGGFVKEQKGNSLERELSVERKVTETMAAKRAGNMTGATTGTKAGAETGVKTEWTMVGPRTGELKGTTGTMVGTTAAIELRHTSYRYGDIYALKDVSLTVAKGAKVALMGPNGAGKSTLISLLNGLEQPVGGEVYLFGERLDPKAREQAHKRLGVVYQDPDDQIFSTTVEEDVAFGPRNLGLNEAEVEERVVTALSSVGMKDYRKRSPFELSYGQKRRVAIAGVLAMQPEIIVLDEPMAFLDPKGRDELQSLLEAMHQMGMTLIVATHDVDFAAEWADDIVILKEGRLLASGGTELLFDEAIIDKADLHLPRLARPFRMLEGAEDLKPKNVMLRRSEEKQVEQKQTDHLRGL
jgi:cobalt transport protein ATP-binding subunit